MCVDSVDCNQTILRLPHINVSNPLYTVSKYNKSDITIETDGAILNYKALRSSTPAVFYELHKDVHKNYLLSNDMGDFYFVRRIDTICESGIIPKYEM